MAEIKTLFVTTLYREEIERADEILPDLEAACRSLAEDDEAGQAWCRRHAYPGYTSYSSVQDLPWRYPAFADLAKRLDRHVAAFAKAVEFDLGRRRLTLDGLWVNILAGGGFHAAQIHPLSVVSGTFYVATPKGSSAIKFEDPRLGLMMAAPPRRPKGSAERQAFVYEAPRAGTLLLWESWLRHEVPLNQSDEDRISISFNYRW
jgi:uncharacterized protein (TIGR02466 family)